MGDLISKGGVPGDGVGGGSHEEFGHRGAGHGERMPALANPWETRAGAVELRLPKLARPMDAAEED